MTEQFVKTTRTDSIWIGLAIVVLICSLIVSEFSLGFIVPSSAVDARKRVHDDIEEIIGQQTLVPQSQELGYKLFPAIDESLVSTSALRNGFDSTAKAIEQYGSPQFFYSVDIGPSISLNFSGNQSRPRKYGADLVQSVEDDTYHIVYSSTGKRIGGCLRQANKVESLQDIFTVLAPILPKEIVHAQFSLDTTANHLQFLAEYGSSDLTSYAIVLFANIGPEGDYFAGFDRVPVSTLSSNPPEFSSFPLVTLPPVARAVAFGLFIFMILACLVLFIVRSSKRALNFPFLIGTSVVMATLLTLASLSLVSSNFQMVLFLALSQSILGLLLYGVTSSSLVSMALENIPEKFYTIHRTALLRSVTYYQGRSVLVGAAFGVILLGLGSLIFIVGNHYGLGWFLAADLTISASGFYLIIHPLVILVSDVLQVGLFYFLITITAYSLAKRITDNSILKLFVAGVLVVLGILLQGILKNGSPVSLLLSTAFTSAILLYLIHKYDVLSVVIAGVTFALVALSPLWLQSSLLTIVAFAAIGGLLAFGIKGYVKVPESVSPDDYKPQFLKDLDQQKRISEELSAAKTVQQRLLPTVLPYNEMLQCAAVCIPANEVGGDYYDVFSLPNGEVGVLVGDVSGKGLSAAFYITLAKGVIASQVQGTTDPGAVLHKVNELLYGMMERGKFISMVYGVINPGEKTFTFANAGHPPSVLYSGKEQTVKFLPMKGMAIGLDSGRRFSQAVHSHCVKLQSEDMVVLYTDGVTESMSGNQHSFDEKGLIRSLKKAGAHPTKVVDTVLADIDAFRGSAAQHDDITLFAFKLL